MPDAGELGAAAADPYRVLQLVLDTALRSNPPHLAVRSELARAAWLTARPEDRTRILAEPDSSRRTLAWLLAERRASQAREGAAP